jgi:hypothetical protein
MCPPPESNERENLQAMAASHVIQRFRFRLITSREAQSNVPVFFLQPLLPNTFRARALSLSFETHGCHRRQFRQCCEHDSHYKYRNSGYRYITIHRHHVWKLALFTTRSSHSGYGFKQYRYRSYRHKYAASWKLEKQCHHLYCHWWYNSACHCCYRLVLLQQATIRVATALGH